MMYFYIYISITLFYKYVNLKDIVHIFNMLI